MIVSRLFTKQLNQCLIALDCQPECLYVLPFFLPKLFINENKDLLPSPFLALLRQTRQREKVVLTG